MVRARPFEPISHSLHCWPPPRIGSSQSPVSQPPKQPQSRIAAGVGARVGARRRIAPARQQQAGLPTYVPTMLHGHSTALSLGSRPGPVHRLWDTAGRALQQHPFLIKTVSSGFGFAFGDVLFQLGTGAALPWTRAAPNAKQARPLDWGRAAAMGGAGLAVAGPVGYYFLMWMEGNIWTAAPHCRAALATKLTLDQALGFALWHAALAAIYEPHRQTCAEMARWPQRQLARRAQQAQQQQQQQRPAALKAQ